MDNRDQPTCPTCGLGMWWAHSMERQACRICEPVPPLVLGGHKEEFCRTCGGHRFWRGRYRPATCVSCHPPASERMVTEYLEGYPPASETTPVAPELVTALSATIQRGKSRGVSRLTLDWEFGGAEVVGAALVRLMARERKLACSTRRGEEAWYYRR